MTFHVFCLHRNKIQIEKRFWKSAVGWIKRVFWKQFIHGGEAIDGAIDANRQEIVANARARGTTAQWQKPRALFIKGFGRCHQ